MLTGFTEKSEKFSDRSQENIKWLELEEAQKRAQETGKPVFVFVEAEWCVYCRQMHREVFPESEVIRMMDEEYLPVSIDLDSRETVIFNGEEMTEREFARSMEVTTTPTILFLNSGGEEMGRQLGYNPADRFLAVLEFVTSDQFGEVSFEQYLKIQGNN
ncbi:MAG: thioredoxin family protein [Balneolaceae bacterium]